MPAVHYLSSAQRLLAATLLSALASFAGCSSSHTTTAAVITGTPAATLSITTMNFPAPTGVAQTTTLTNSGTGILAISGVTITGTSASSFAESNNCNTLAAAATCTVSVVFQPAYSGNLTATLNILDNATGSPQTITLTGVGAPATVSLSATSLSYNTSVGATSLAQSVTLTNAGPGSALFNGITLGGTNASSFTQSTTCGQTLAPTASCTVSAIFKPTALGTYNATITIADTSTTSPHIITLTGTTPNTGTIAAISDSTTFTLTNVASGMVLGVSGQSQLAAANMVQEPNAATPDIYWHVMPMNNNQYNIENMLTHQVMGISAASTAAGAQVLQYSDNGTADHLWEFFLLPDGNYLLENVNSSLYLEDAGSNLTTSATIDQGARAPTGAGCTCQEWTLTSTGTSPYPAPLSNSATSIHDPSMIKVGSNYYAFGTHGSLYSFISTDRINFTSDGFGLASLPAWTNTYDGSDSDLWAPDVSAHNGKYWLYFAASTFGSSNSAIGLATSTTGAPGTYVDSGAAILTSGNCTGSNAIDPASLVDFSGNAWLSFGSFANGIHVVPVNNTTGLPSGSCSLISYRQTGGEEGSYIYKHGTYYYLFASINACCNGVTSTYRVVVGRSTAVTGPYTDRGGVAMTSGGGTIVLSAHGTINGPGGQDLFADTDGDILVYHYYDGNNNGTPALGVNHISWTTDGWPYVAP